MVNAITVSSVLRILGVSKWLGSQIVNNCLSGLWDVPELGSGGHKAIWGEEGLTISEQTDE